jgi:membrane fusion protein, copper/silver efflux system
MKTLLTLLVFLATLLQAKPLTVEQLFNVQTVKVKEVSSAKSIKSFGYVTVDSSLVYDVNPRFGGFIEKLYADKLYKKVKKGEILAKVYSPEVLKAKDEYINSLRYSKNKTMVQSAKRKLQLLKIPNYEINPKAKNRDITTILSPTNGYIFEKSVENNSAFNAKETLFKIVNLDKVWIEVKIHQHQLSKLKSIKSFTLSSPALEKSFQTTKSKLYPELDPKEESFTLRLELNNLKTDLKPGMYMNVMLHQEKKSYLTLPSTAVIRKNGKFYAFVAGEYEGEYEPLEIEVEILDPNTYSITSGLVAGDEVVNNALFMMDSDAQINGLY